MNPAPLEVGYCIRADRSAANLLPMMVPILSAASFFDLIVAALVSGASFCHFLRKRA